jgi:uncharacterized membrane protein YbaN (DUF454 family)
MLTNIKKFLYFTLGCFCIVMAYIGVVTPGIPYSPFVVAAAFCFARSSERAHRWIMNHRIFGPFLTNWSTKRVFPQRMKYLMIGMMSLSLALMTVSGVKPIGILSTGIFMLLVAVWAWRYPSTVDEHDQRVANGKKIGWFNNKI